ncbi:MAG: flagellar biosynthesis protein FliQ [Candidatus Hydrogenedentes bacterium]|nr:flagellar biosynthesis protein FliQ [Candidatus Hydrogenedentota bacterium]
MNADTILELGRNAMLMTLLLSAPMLISGMLIGLIISVFQSVTQIQEITLTFVPKIVVVMVAFVLFLPWMIAVMLTYARPLFGGFTGLLY